MLKSYEIHSAIGEIIFPIAVGEFKNKFIISVYTPAGKHIGNIKINIKECGENFDNANVILLGGTKKRIYNLIKRYFKKGGK